LKKEETLETATRRQADTKSRRWKEKRQDTQKKRGRRIADWKEGGLRKAASQKNASGEGSKNEFEGPSAQRRGGEIGRGKERGKFHGAVSGDIRNERTENRRRKNVGGEIPGRKLNKRARMGGG